MKLYLLYRQEQESQELEADFVVAEADVSVVPPPRSLLSVVLYQDAGEGKMADFCVVDEARYYLVNTRKAFPHLTPPSGVKREGEASLYIEPVDEAARQWVEGIIKQTVADHTTFGGPEN